MPTTTLKARTGAEPDNNPPHLGQARHARAGKTHPGLATEREPRRAGVSNSGSPRARRQPTPPTTGSVQQKLDAPASIYARAQRGWAHTETIGECAQSG